jgi:hypothetical protein
MSVVMKALKSLGVTAARLGLRGRTALADGHSATLVFPAIDFRSW